MNANSKSLKRATSLELCDELLDTGESVQWDHHARDSEDDKVRFIVLQYYDKVWNCFAIFYSTVATIYKLTSDTQCTLSGTLSSDTQCTHYQAHSVHTVRHTEKVEKERRKSRARGLSSSSSRSTKFD